jgi:large subunit ribosomal protein L24
MKSKKLKKNLRTGDTVVIISGRDKGKVGSVKRIDRKKLRLIVEGAFVNKKHVRKNQEEIGIVEKESWISFSKVRKSS